MEKFPKMKISDDYYQDEYHIVRMEGFIGKDLYEKLLIYEPNGELGELYHYKNDKEHGLYQIFYDGILFQQGYCFNDKYHGRISFYNDDGSIKRWEEYEHGEWISSSDGLTIEDLIEKHITNYDLDLKKLSEKYRILLEKK